MKELVRHDEDENLQHLTFFEDNLKYLSSSTLITNVAFARKGNQGCVQQKKG